ncbi:MAG TPA: hypothetical protein VFS25_13250 [Chitinophaga sp.]|uniref:hypothetical protein n=1 Tax=Chitinophaga sp. TaxID=1869181 RepID=UPI002DBFA939|nr:hypothetical protein [Chitinophaga sp.]HEU4553801.1 hypothetical protein [Chitinophaga sp.]
MVNFYLRKFYCRIVTLLAILSFGWRLPAIAGNTDSLKTPAPAVTPLAVENAFTATRSFPEIDRQLLAGTVPAPAEGLFTEEYLQAAYGADSANPYREQAKAAFLQMDKENRYTTSLSPDDLNVLPIGLYRKVNNTTVKIAVSNATFYPTYAELTVYAKLEIPQEPHEIFFGIKGIKLSYNGGILGDAKLVLLGDIPIRINGGAAALILKGGMNMETGQGLDLTYVTMDCNGFKELGLSAEVVFPRTMLVPLKADGERDENPNAQVKAAFKTVVADWNDILVSLSLPAFEIAPLKGVGFHIGKAVFDASDIRNTPDIVYPAGYEQRYMPADNPNTWRGVYVEDLEVILPKQFAKREQPGQRVSFGAQHMIIDNNGLTGSFFANNILPDGTASGWKFTVDRFNIDLEANHLTGAGFSGMVGLPVAKDPLGYTAVITADNEYILKLSTLNEMSFSVWQAKCTLEPNSWVQLKLADGRFQPEAMLHGTLGISATTKGDDGKPIATFKGIVFKNLHLETNPPYLTASYFGYTNNNTVSNFPVSINEIALRAQNGEASLTFGIRINLMEQHFGGDTKISLVGKFDEKEGIQTWKFDKLKLDEIAVNAKISSQLKIEGRIKIYDDDPVYGNAISGMVGADFMDGKVKIEARAMFGSKDYRYWYVDAKADLGLGIPLVPPINIQGFGGGAYYHMKKQGVDMLASPTGVNYVPDENTGLGIKAAVLFNIVKKEVVNGEVSFEVAFNKSGGVNFVGFYGYAKILGVLPNVAGNMGDYMSKQFSKLEAAEQGAISKLGGVGEKLQSLKVSNPSAAAESLAGNDYKTGESGLSAYVGMQYDFTQSTFHANFDVYLNVAGGIIAGTASGNRAGWAEIHVAPGEWYFYMGTPTNRLGVKFALGSIAIKTGAYIMVGDKIPGSPPPPQEVADILGMELSELDYMRDLNALGDGRGFAFGANLTVETGDITFLILYANFKCGVGFDIMLKDYGDAHCVGKTDKIGIDGWYANGQAYVYLQGEVGVKVNLAFIKGRFPIISGAAAVLMQAKLPNPTWLRGYMAVKFKILGGLVSGNMRMKVTIGDECEIVTGTNSPIDVKMIADLTPADNSGEVDVFTAPQAAFNMRIGQTFDVEDDNGVKTYRARLESFTVTDNGQPIPGRLEWNANNDAVTFYSKEVLPTKHALKAAVKVTFEELQNGAWQTLYMNGQKSEEEKVVSFTTGTAPDFIPLENIAYCYPVVEQRNLFKDEIPRGYVVLQRGQSYLFDPRWRYQLNFASNGAVFATQQMQYDSINQRIDFTLPALQNNNKYTFDVIAIPPGGNAGTNAIVSYAKQDNGEDGDYTVKANKASNVSRGDVTKSLLGYNFKTSKYNTFAAKMQAINTQRSIAGYLLDDVIDLRAEVGEHEDFDIPELTGNAYTAYQPLVNATAITDDVYFTNDIEPVLYKEYPIHQDITISYRDTDTLGIVPRKAISILSAYLAESAGGAVSGWSKSMLPYVYNLPIYYKQDFTDLQYQVVNRFLGTPEQNRYAGLIIGHYPFIRYGKYKVEYQYLLPGGDKGTSTVFEYLNPIR